MNRQLFLVWPLLMIGAVILLGCQAKNQVRQTEPKETHRNHSVNAPRHTKLSLLRTIPLPASALRVKRIALSDDGTYVAMIDADSIQDRLHVWSTNTGKLVYSLKPGYGLSDISWNPRKQELAYSAASGESMSSAAPIRGFGFVTIPSGKLRTTLNLQLDENIPFDWTSDGRYLVTDFSVFDPQTKQNERYKVDGNTSARTVKDVAISQQAAIAEEVVDSRTELPSVLVLEETSPNFSSLRKMGELASKPNYDTNETIIRTQPRFLADGRLSYVWVQLDPNNKPKDAEIRTCNRNARDEHSLVALPKLGQGTEGAYSITPLTWNSDGKILAITDSKQIKLFRLSDK